jgi:hypothetical protein
LLNSSFHFQLYRIIVICIRNACKFQFFTTHLFIHFSILFFINNIIYLHANSLCNVMLWRNICHSIEFFMRNMHLFYTPLSKILIANMTHPLFNFQSPSNCLVKFINNDNFFRHYVHFTRYIVHRHICKLHLWWIQIFGGS